MLRLASALLLLAPVALTHNSGSNDDLDWGHGDIRTVNPRKSRDTYFDDAVQEVTVKLHDLVDGVLFPRKVFSMMNTMGHAIHCRDTLEHEPERYSEFHADHCREMLRITHERIDGYPAVDKRICKTIFGTTPPDRKLNVWTLANSTLENNYKIMETYWKEHDNVLLGRDMRWMTGLIADTHLLREERLFHDGNVSAAELRFHQEADWNDLKGDQGIFALKCSEHPDVDVYGSVWHDTYAVP